MVAAQLDVAVGADHEQRAVAQLAGEELEQQQRGLVGPVQVVEDEHQRPRGGGAGEEARDRVEEAEARLLVLGVLGAALTSPTRSATSGTSWAMSAAPAPISQASATGSASRT